MNIKDFFGKSLFAASLLSACLLGNNAFAKNLPLEGHVLDVGLSPIPPFVIINGEFSDLSGIDVDIIRELQRRTGFTLNQNRFHIMSLVDLLDIGKQGQLDICASAIPLTADKAQDFTLSPTTYRSKYVLVVPSDSNITNRNDLVGKTIAAEDGSDPTDLLPENIASQIKVTNQHTTFMTFYSVAAGEADAMLAEEPMATDVVDDWAMGKLKVAYTVRNSDRDIGMIFKKDTFASRVLYDTFKEMQADGTIQDIVHKYVPNYVFPADLQPQNINLNGETAIASNNI